MTQKISDEDIQIDGNRLEAQLIAPEMLTQRVTNKMVPLGTLPLPGTRTFWRFFGVFRTFFGTFQRLFQRIY